MSFDAHFGWIEANRLATSACPADAAEIRWLHEQGIRAIVSLTETPLTAQEEITPDLFRELGISYFHAPIEDFMPPNVARLWRIVAFIQEMRRQRRPVLIHCMAGEGRNCTILHAYYRAQGAALEAVKSRIREVRPVSRFENLSASQQRFLEEFAASLNS